MMLASDPVAALEPEPAPPPAADSSTITVRAPAASSAPVAPVPALTPIVPEPRVPSPLPEIAAIFPGVLLHGAGAWLQHRDQTAQRLLLLEGAAVLTTFASGFVLLQTGAARDVVGPAALGAVAGVGGFGTSLAANLYATWAPRRGFGEPLRRVPLLESSAGYLYVYDPQFDYRHFATAQVVARPAAWRIGANLAWAPGRENQRFELLAGYRVLGPRGKGDPAASDGSYLEPRLGFSAHRFERDGFSSRVIELALEGRLDVERYLPDVHGAFFQGEAGYARQVIVNDLPGPNPATWTSLLLARVGFGIYLGNRASSDTAPGDGDAADEVAGHPAHGQTGGEVQLYYDHRHDGFAGGLKVNGLGSGVAGHFGLLGSYQLTPEWGVRLRTEAGSAYTLGVDAVLRTW